MSILCSQSQSEFTYSAFTLNIRLLSRLIRLLSTPEHSPLLADGDVYFRSFLPLCSSIILACAPTSIRLVTSLIQDRLGQTNQCREH